MGRPEQTVSISSPAKVANEKQNWRICIPSFISRVWLQRKPEGQMQRDRRLERLPAHWEGAAWLHMLMVCVKVQPGGSLGLRICLFGSHTVPQKAENASGLGQQWGSPPSCPGCLWLLFCLCKTDENSTFQKTHHHLKWMWDKCTLALSCIFAI